MTDRQREEIDAETKQLLRELSASIRNLADAEELRQKTATTLTRKKYSKLGLLGSWAAGGGAQTKSGDQELEEAKSHTVSGHRESVLWYLRQKLQECGSFQATMMEKRILREVEKRRSLLANSDMGSMPRASFEPPPIPAPIYKRSVPEQTRTEPEDELSAEQIQMFEKQSQDMLKHYESTLDQVRYAAGMSKEDGPLLTPSLLGQPKNPLSRYPNFRPNLLTISTYNQNISTSWNGIPTRLKPILTVEISN